MKSLEKFIKHNKNIILVTGALLFIFVLISGINLSPASWFMPTKYVKVTDTSIEYYVGVSGNCWTTTLKDPSGIAINTQKGCSYGTHSFPRPEAEGTYKICILPDYKPSSYVECEPVFVPAKVVATPVVTTPAVTTPAVTLTTPATTTPAVAVTTPGTSYQCQNGDWVYDPDDCPVSTQSTPGFEAVFAIVGLLAVLLLRKYEK